MKKILLFLVFVVFATISALALPKGKYSDGGDSTIIVMDTRMTLYIGMYKAADLTILEIDHENQTFVVTSNGSDRTYCRWYYENGSLYIQIGKNRILKYCD